MSALDPTQSAKKIVYCYASTGVTESKGGVSWTKGVIGTGVGTPALPYVDLDEALKAVRAFEAQELTTQNYEFRLVTDPAETTDYGQVVYNNDDANYPSTDIFHFIFSGWLKTWGDPVYGDKTGKWETTDDFPTFDHFDRQSSAGNVHGPKRMTWRGITMTNTGTGTFDVRTNTATVDGSYIRMRGCILSGTSSLAGSVVGAVSNQNNNLGWFACLFLDTNIDSPSIFTPTNGKASLFGAVNCYFQAISQAAIKISNFFSGGVFRLSNVNALSCIFNLNGAPAYHNVGGSNAETALQRDNNRYWVRTAQFAKWLPTTLETVFSASGTHDANGSSGDPDIISDTDPTFNSTSPVLDKGARPNDAAIYMFDDPTGNEYHLIDALNIPWGDSVDLNSPLVESGAGVFSHRGVGPIQHVLGFVLPPSDVVWPEGIIPAGSSNFVAAAVPVDEDGAGTCQPRFGQATDGAFTSGVSNIDACPLNVAASKTKIDFKEDAGSELTATLTSGIYNTAELMAEIKIQMEATGSGTYTVTYDSGTEKVTIAVSGGASTVQLLFATGTNTANAANVNLGYRGDTADSASLLADDPTLENDHNSSLTYEFSDDYDGVSDPALNGTWNALGTGEPSDSGVEGVDGVDCDSPGKFVRCNLGDILPLNNKYHRVKFWSGNKKSASVPV